MSNSTKDATETLYKFARLTPFNIAPERAEKLASEIFGSGKWLIKPSETEANFYAIAQDSTIYLSYAGLASLWCLSYAGFHIMDIASQKNRLNKAQASEFIDIGNYCATLRLNDYISYSRSLFHSNCDWPDSLSLPSNAPSFNSADGRINNTFFGALSWIILHEIAHVHNNDERFIPASMRVRQEYRADDFATKWILGDAGQGKKREFRVLMISVALTWLFLQESEKGQGVTHPPAILRFRESAAQFKMGKRSAGLENAVYLFKAVLDPLTPPPSLISALDAFEWMSNRLEQIFPDNS